ncbi:MAG: hypothetical protein M0Z51_00160 [Propionibacterium sp.]|nr:hypothetical protein [Propionibacterium sp.]
MTLRRRLAAAGFAAAVALTPVTVLTSGYLSAAPAIAAPAASAAATSAGTWLAGQFTDGQYYTSPYTNKADISGTADLLLGLLASRTGQSTATAVDTWLKAQTPTVTSAGQLAKLAIVASAMGDDPASYGGVDLITRITDAVTASSTGDLGDPYSDALAIIALHRAGATVPASLITGLVGRQDSQGEFYFGTSGTSSYFTDPDSTGVAIAALGLVKADSTAATALSRAVAWAVADRTPTGYWSSYSPVNTTGLIGSALRDQGTDVTSAVAWMQSQQADAGGSGLPADLNGTHPDAYATAQGLLLLGGVSLATDVLAPAASVTPTPSVSPSPSVSATPSPAATSSSSTGPLPATGDHGTPATTVAGGAPITLAIIGAASVGLVAAGAARSRRRS